MSLILDALNRADQERSVDSSSPNLQTSHSPAPPVSNPVRRWLIEGVIIAIALAAFVYSQWPNKDVSVEQVAEPLTINNIQTASKPVVPIADNSSNIQAKPLDSAQLNPVITQPPINKAIEQPKVIAKPAAENTAIASLYQQQTTSSNADAQTNKTVAIASTRPQPLAAAEIDNTESILLQIPLLTEHSAQFQRSVPSIDYAIHVYSENDKAGFVKLNGSIRKIGAEIAPGLRVIAILKDSLVLDYKGTQFRLAALNSWMNFN